MYVIHFDVCQEASPSSWWSTAAIEIADEAGLAAVTMAAVAQRCGFTTMSLYRHVASKDELVRRMLDEVLGTAPDVGVAGLARRPGAMVAGDAGDPRPPPVGHRHPDHRHPRHPRAALLAGPGSGGASGTGLHDGEKAEIALLLNGYVFWSARLRSQVSPEATDVIPGALDIDQYPALASAVAAGIFSDGSTPEDDFAFGLERILDGVGALIAQRSA